MLRLFVFGYIFLSFFASIEKEKTRYASGVELRSSKEKTASGGFSCFQKPSTDFVQNGTAHFKHVYLVGETDNVTSCTSHPIPPFCQSRTAHGI